MPTFYIHAGMPKTGTKSLQHFLNTHHEYIFTKNNIYLPQTGRYDSSYAWHPHLFKYGFDKCHPSLLKHSSETLDNLMNELQEYKDSNILLSDETLGINAIPKEWIERINHCLPDHNIKIICYLRRLDDSLRSLFKQFTNWPYKFKIKDYHTFLKDVYTLKSAPLFPTNWLEEHAALIGKENIYVRIYDKTVLKNNNIIDDFFDILNIELPAEFSRDKDYHKSLYNHSIPFLSKAILPAGRNTKLCKNIFQQVQTAFSFKPGTGAGENILPEIDKEIDKIDSLYCPGYKKLFEENKCSFEFPELDVEPYKILTTSLIYQLIQENDEIKKEIKKEKELIGEVAQQVTSINQQAVSVEKTVNTIDQRTDVLEQKNNAINQRTYDIDQRTYDIDQRTYVTEKKINEIDLRTYLLEQTINNISNQTNNLELILKDILFNTTEHFPNNKQKFFLFFYTPFIKLIAEKKYYNKFKENPAVFFANTKNPINKGFLKFLEIFGPKAIPKGN